jgi:hypothetical protein
LQEFVEYQEDRVRLKGSLRVRDKKRLLCRPNPCFAGVRGVFRGLLGVEAGERQGPLVKLLLYLLKR